MSSSGKRQQSIPARGEGRERILEAAAELFLTKRFASVSMQQIADSAGITKAAIYYHFPDKEALFAEVSRRLVDQFWEGLIVRAEAGGTLRETLSNIADYLVESSREMYEGGSYWNIDDDIHRHLSPETQMALFTEHPDPEEPLRRLFQRAIEAGEMRPLDVERVAGMFVAMTLSLSHSGHQHRHAAPEDARLLVDVLLNGIAAR